MTTHDPEWIRGAGVIVTGAGSGIGRALARRLTTAGARVVVSDLDRGSCTAVADEIGARAVPGDAASVDGVQAMISTAREHLGAVDAFFANAGVETGADDTPESWDLSWNVNLMAHVHAATKLLPDWLEAGRGRLVVTASAAGLLTMLGSAPYSVAKHAAVAYAEWLSVTYGDRGLTVQCLCPQGVDTPMLPAGDIGDVVFGDNVLGPDQVAEEVVRALHGNDFYILPHPEVADFYATRATQPDRWLRGMRRMQAELDARRT
ncbi:SDR family oxidoreductase [Dietzia kunjamensis]|uniref:SDR family oxidoreductase n=1 Tax=Dietzia kunjamensis TaxID=322509 RepID=UPI0033661A5B